MKQTFYTIYDQQNYTSKSELFDHYICENEKTRIIVPIKFHKNSINPVNFLQLKIKYKIKKIVILDRTKPNFKKASIVGHVNRSGFNFFVGSKRIPRRIDARKTWEKNFILVNKRNPLNMITSTIRTHYQVWSTFTVPCKITCQLDSTIKNKRILWQQMAAS